MLALICNRGVRVNFIDYYRYATLITSSQALLVVAKRLTSVVSWSSIVYMCGARKHHVPATVQYLYQRSVADAHGDWAESWDQSWFADRQGPR